MQQLERVERVALEVIKDAVAVAKKAQGLLDAIDAEKRELRRMDMQWGLSQIGVRKTEPLPPHIARRSHHKQPAAGVGLRQAVRDALDSARGPMTAKEVRAVVVKRGVKVMGHTSLAMRVVNELSRMKRVGEVERTANQGWIAVQPSRERGHNGHREEEEKVVAAH